MASAPTTATSVVSPAAGKVTEVKWAQNHSSVMLAFILTDVDESTLRITVEPQLVTFAAMGRSIGSGGQVCLHESKIELCDVVNTNDWTKNVFGLEVLLVLKKAKADANEPYWPRLLKSSGRTPAWLRVDFDRWCDEDDNGEDEEAAKNKPFGNADPFEDYDLSKLMSKYKGSGAAGLDAGGSDDEDENFEDENEENEETEDVVAEDDGENEDDDESLKRSDSKQHGKGLNVQDEKDVTEVKTNATTTTTATGLNLE